MEIRSASTPSFDESKTILSITAGKNETIAVGQIIKIKLIDETIVERQIVSMERWVQPEEAKKGKFKNVDSISNGESAEATVDDLDSCYVQTSSMPSAEERREWSKRIFLTSFKEINGGNESIFDHIREGYTVPGRVIAYLMMGKLFLMSPGAYEHPFIKGKNLLGPYLYTDDVYVWDRDTWKYVLKYGLELPQEFIDHVMTDEGKKFIDQQIDANDEWSGAVKAIKKSNDYKCLLPVSLNDMGLDEF